MKAQWVQAENMNHIRHIEGSRSSKRKREKKKEWMRMNKAVLFPCYKSCAKNSQFRGGRRGEGIERKEGREGRR